MPIYVDMKDDEKWERIAKKYDATADEVKRVGLKLALRGAAGNYENELKQLDRGPYSSEPEQWWDEKIREILSEIRAM